MQALSCPFGRGGPCFVLGGAVAANGKTREKSPFNGAPLIPGNPGNSGGKKGRSGRKPTDFVQWCKDLLADETVRRVAEARAKSGDTKVLEFAAKYSQSPAPTQHQVDAIVTFKAIRE